MLMQILLIKKDLINAIKNAADANLQKMGFQLLISWVDNDNISLEEEALSLSTLEFNEKNKDLLWWWLQVVHRTMPCQNLSRDNKPSSELHVLAQKVFTQSEKIIRFIKTEIEENWKENEISSELSSFDEFRISGALLGEYENKAYC